MYASSPGKVATMALQAEQPASNDALTFPQRSRRVLLPAPLPVPTARPYDRGGNAPSPPPQDSEVVRTELVQLMQPAKSATRIWFIIAPAGCGKTSLLGQLRRALRSEGRGLAWLSVSGPLGSSLGDSSGGQPGGAPLHEIADEYLEVLRKSPPTAFFLDSLERLQQPSSQELLQHLINEWPPEHTLYCAGRSLRNLRIGHRLIDGVARVLGPDDLAFDDTELSVLARNLDVAAESPVLGDIGASCASSWPVGARALLLASKTGEYVAEGIPTLLERYLEESVWEEFRPAELGTLMDLATLETFNLLLLSGLPGKSVHWEDLNSLRAAGAYIESVQGECIYGSREWFRLHPLVGHVLARRQLVTDPMRAMSLHRYAATWLEELGCTAKAAKHAAYCRESYPTPFVQEAEGTRGGSRLGIFEGALRTTLEPDPSTGVRDSSVLNLSPRETEVLALIADGLSAKEVSDRLALSISTVKTHQKKLYRKLRVAKRSHAIARARAIGII